MTQQTLELIGVGLCLLASMGGTLFVMSSFDRWCCDRNHGPKSRRHAAIKA